MAHRALVVVPVQKIVLDIFLVMCVGFPILFLFLWGNAYHRGFFCEDTSIRHPYHESTVPSIYLYITGIVMNCIVMSLTEYLTRDAGAAEVAVAGVRLPQWVWNAYNVLLVFAFGGACSQLSTDIMKYTVGRLRPHFYMLCVPSVDCAAPENRLRYHIDFNCTNERYLHNRKLMKEMRLSFPSGHSSFSMYTMMYFAIYLQRRMTWDGSRLLKHTLQFLAIIFSIFTGMTRVSDYKHHWSDVLIGMLIGSITACSVARFASTLFENRKLPAVEKVHVPMPAQRTDSTNNELNSLNGNRAQLVYGAMPMRPSAEADLGGQQQYYQSSKEDGAEKSLESMSSYNNPSFLHYRKTANDDAAAEHNDPLLIDISQ